MKNQAEKIKSWGAGYFGINPEGNVVCYPTRDKQQSVCLQEVVQQTVAAGYQPPFTICFPQIIAAQLHRIEEAFAAAMREFNYPRRHYGVFPLKVNQSQSFVQSLLKYGHRYDYGLEVGSKAELVAAMGLPMSPDALLICNGFKDKEFIELICLAATKHRNTVAVIESLAELQPLLTAIRTHDTIPQLGFRVRLSQCCSSRWNDNTSFASKFGLTTFELLQLLQELQKNDCAAQVCMLHFHAGSQITEIRTFKRALKEAARIYAKVVKMGFALQYLNIGGGLGVNYEDRNTSQFNTNYEPQEFINDAVYVIAATCREEGLPVPFIVSESGRVIAAYYSLVVTDICKAHTAAADDRSDALAETENPLMAANAKAKKKSKPLRELSFLNANLNADTLLEYYHDAIEHYSDLQKLFNLGFIDLVERAEGEQLYMQICIRVHEFMKAEPRLTGEFKRLQQSLVSKYLANFSIFQSLPDAWALKQLFPVLPLSRQQQATADKAHIVDITCDSDGCLSQFIDRDFLELHTAKNKTCYLGFFLVGAYQSSLGNNHNLFGTTHTIEVMASNNNYTTEVETGDNVDDLLRRNGYDQERLVAEFSKNLPTQRRQELLGKYKNSLNSYPYLNLSSSVES